MPARSKCVCVRGGGGTNQATKTSKNLTRSRRDLVAACYDHAFDMCDPGVCDVIDD